MPHKYNIYPVKDNNEKKIKKKDKIFSLPARILLTAKTSGGKGVWMCNALLRPEYYYGDFKGEDIYWFSPSIKHDAKTQICIKNLDIPPQNLFSNTKNINEDLGAVLEFIEKNYEDAVANKEKPVHSLVVMDDCLPNLKSNNNGAVQDLFIRSRHFMCSAMCTLQYYNKLLNTCRNNANGLVVFEVNTKQLEDIEQDHNYLDDKKEFRKLYKKAIEDGGKHGSFIINYTNEKKDRYLNGQFENIILKDEENKK